MFERDDVSVENTTRSIEMMCLSKTQHDVYAPQTKILEGRTNVSERVFEALFKGVSTVFGLQNVEKCFENAL